MDEFDKILAERGIGGTAVAAPPQAPQQAPLDEFDKILAERGLNKPPPQQAPAALPPAAPAPPSQPVEEPPSEKDIEVANKLHKNLEFLNEDPERWFGSGSVRGQLGKIPFAGVGFRAAEAYDLNKSNKAIEAGTHTDSDLMKLAKAIGRENYEKKKTWKDDKGQIIGEHVAHAPGMILEFLATGGASAAISGGVKRALMQVAEKQGAQMALGKLGTAGVALASHAPATIAQIGLLPGMYVEPAMQENIAAGRAPFDPRGFPVPLTAAAAQLGIMQLAGVGVAKIPGFGGSGPISATARTALQAPAGALIGGAATEATRAVGLTDGHDWMTDLARGDKDEALKKATGHAINFMAFHLAGEVRNGLRGPETIRPIIEKIDQKARQLEKQGIAPESELMKREIEKVAEAEVKPPEPQQAPPKVEKPTEKTVRMYHGGEEGGEGPRWFSPDEAYARGYAEKSGGTVQYVDVPESSRFLEKAFDDSGANVKAPYINTELPADISNGRRKLSETPVSSPPEAAPAPPGEQTPIGGPKTTETPLEAPRTPGTYRGVEAGWKLHLGTDSPQEVSKILAELGLKHKVGKSGGQDGKDLTVYVGSKDAADKAAEAIEGKAGHLLKEPSGDAAKDDRPFTKKVVGRYDVAGTDTDFHQYGDVQGNGVPWLKGDMDPYNRRPGATERADAELRRRYGEHYTGTPLEAPGTVGMRAGEPGQLDVTKPLRPTEPVGAIEPDPGRVEWYMRRGMPADQARAAAIENERSVAELKAKNPQRGVPEEVAPEQPTPPAETPTLGMQPKPPPSLKANRPAPPEVKIEPPMPDPMDSLTPKQRYVIEHPALKEPGGHKKIAETGDIFRADGKRYTPARIQQMERDANKILAKQSEAAQRREAAGNAIADMAAKGELTTTKVRDPNDADVHVTKKNDFEKSIHQEIDAVLAEIDKGDASGQNDPVVRAALFAKYQRLAADAERGYKEKDRQPVGGKRDAQEAPPVQEAQGAAPQGKAPGDATRRATSDELKREKNPDLAPIFAKAKEAGIDAIELHDRVAEMHEQDPRLKYTENVAEQYKQAAEWAGKSKPVKNDLDFGFGANERTPPGFHMLPPMGSKTQEAIGRALKEGAHQWAEMGGASFPRTGEIAPDTGIAASRVAGNEKYVKQAAPMIVEKVMGKAAANDPATRSLFGTTFAEERQRHARNYHSSEMARLWAESAQAAAAGDAVKAKDLKAEAVEHGKKMAAIKSFVGKPNSPLETEADYRNTSQSSAYKEFAAKWPVEMVPEMEANYRSSRGMDELDPINDKTQIPGRPFNAIAVVDPANYSETTVFLDGKPKPVGNVPIGAGGGAGKLKNALIPEFKFAKEAGLDAPAYETDILKIVENTLRKGGKAARIAEYYRKGMEEGLIEKAPAGQGPEGFTEMEFATAPKGSNLAEKGEAFYIKTEAYKEYRKLFELDSKAQLPFGLTKAAEVATKVTLFAPTVETTAHGTNLLTKLFDYGPKAILQLFSKNMPGVWRNTMESQEGLAHLAKIDALKPHGFESGNITPPHALAWIGRLLQGGADVLNFMDKSVRLSGRDAYMNMVKRGLETYSDAGLRDFVNGLGNYNRRSQSKFVTDARETQIQPFATAAVNFAVHGIRAVTGNPGVKGSSPMAHAQLRAEKLLRVWGTALGLVSAVNYILWKNVFGDDNTPLFAIKIGEKDGKTIAVDVGRWTGLTRGLRAIGGLAIAEGMRKGQSKGQIIDNAFKGAVQTALHTIEGPGVAFAHTAVTGENTLGQKIAREPGEGESKLSQNVEAALWNVNPVAGSLSGHDVAEKRQVPYYERVSKLAGPLGPKFREQVPPEVENFRHKWDKVSKDHAKATKNARMGLPMDYDKKSRREYEVMAPVQKRLGEINQHLRGEQAGSKGQMPSEARKKELREMQRKIIRKAFERLSP